MALKTAYVTLGPDAGRDAGKTYFVTEMVASQAESWGERLLLALAKGGVEVPPNFFGLGMQALFIVSIRALAGARWEDAKPLLDEMMACIQAVPDPARPQVMRTLVESDIEEVSSRLRLRDEVIALHVGFSLRERWSTLTSRGRADPTATDAAPPGNGTSANTGTSPRA